MRNANTSITKMMAIMFKMKRIKSSNDTFGFQINASIIKISMSILERWSKDTFPYFFH